MAGKKWTDAEIARIIEIVNDYPGCYIHAFRTLSPELKRSVNSIRLKFNEVKFDYETPIIVSATGKKTPNGIIRWNSKCVPDIKVVRRWTNIKHLLFK